jgi:CheY-like chemotaxis protein
MQGPEVIAQLRAINPDVRIVAMSGMLEDCAGAGTDAHDRLAFVPKPMTGRALVRALQQVLGAGRDPA